MDRRAFVEGAGTLVAVALAGCLSVPAGDGVPGGDAGEDATDTPTPTGVDAPGTVDEPTTTPTGTDSPHTGEFAADFEVRSVRSGTGENGATVEFADGRVTVDGTIGGRNGCYTARLGEATRADGSLRVLVEAYEDRDDDEMCTDALVDVDYVATFGFEETPPGRVVVEHDSMGDLRTVADENR